MIESALVLIDLSCVLEVCVTFRVCAGGSFCDPSHVNMRGEHSRDSEVSHICDILCVGGVLLLKIFKKGEPTLLIPSSSLEDEALSYAAIYFVYFYRVWLWIGSVYDN